MKCLIEKKCGSCKYINTDYQRQLKIKTDYCKKLLKDNKLDMYEVKDTIGMGHPYEYRNKIIVAFNHRYEFGFYEEDSHKIIPYDRCLLHEELSDMIIKKIQSLLKRYRVSIYDENRNRGLLRHVLIRRALVTSHVETVVLLSKGEVDSKKIRVEFSLEDMDMSEFQDGATYTQIKDYVLEHSGLKVSNLYISQIKRKCGIEVGKNYNLPKSEDSRQPLCPPEKEKAIREAFKYFGMI